jgi:hypothetical protein
LHNNQVQWNLPLDNTSNSRAESVVNFQLKRLVRDGKMTQAQLDKMNDALQFGLENPKAQEELDSGWDKIAEFVESHGHIKGKDFGTIKRDEIMCMMIDNISDRCATIANP